VGASSRSGQLVLSVLSAVSAWQRQAIAERTRAALRHLRDWGQVYNSEVAYGFWREGKKLVPVPAELAAVARMLALRRQGLSLRQIGEILRQEGIRTKHGRKRWTAETVRGILNREDFYTPRLENFAGGASAG